MGGSSKKATVGYKYYVGVHTALCHGPVDKLVRIRVGGKDAWAGGNTGGALTSTCRTCLVARSVRVASAGRLT